MSSRTFVAVVCALWLALAGAVPLAEASPFSAIQIRQLIINKLQRKKATVGVFIGDALTGETLFEYNGSSSFTPASVVKIVTSVAALRILGPQYKFPTEFFVDTMPVDDSGRVGTLYIRGYGDPTMVTERLWKVASDLRVRGVTQIDRLVVDDTLFIDPPAPSGPRAYQAGNSALSLNHNSYAVSVVPSVVGRPARTIVTDGYDVEIRNTVQTVAGHRNRLVLDHRPPSPSFSPVARSERLAGLISLQLDPPTVITSGSVGAKNDVITNYRTVPYPPVYFAQVFRRLLRAQEITVGDEILVGQTPAQARLLIVEESIPLVEILRDLNHYSNNFIAEQLVFAMGQDDVGYFRHDLGVGRMARFLESLGVAPGSFSIVDGSGLSREDKLSPAQLHRVLVEAYRDFSLLPGFVSSLSRFGESGTLRKRPLLSRRSGRTEVFAPAPPELGVWGKTGTLTGVSSVCGYLRLPNSRTITYVVMINGRIAKSVATDLEDAILKGLIRHANPGTE
ncbi:MAG: D-alanyl-D-alanine carboxypeptidase/D-alanyl-D-alanine-endopeptidase [Bdellovibrionales bacterium]|nr:D-alanyl-D-alanine carboxypeptidase/D-alanyl-D-alanine-endopeptidase [Bdellovibrionales bacterium]